MEGQAVEPLEPGAVVNGRYRVLRQINAGGMGAVYEVLDSNTRRRLALKTLRPGLVADSSLLTRFEQEASITAAIDSDHVVKVEDFGLDPIANLVFFTMELLVGKDLGALVEERGPLPPKRVARLLWQVASALSCVHAAGIVHRDLKPENLFLKQRTDGEDFIKILDFGVAKALESDEKTTALVGTRLYMPPEQLRGEAPDARADVFALGQVAFTLLTGHPYLEPGHPEEAATERAARFGVKLPARFDIWFERATAVKRSERFDTVLELALELWRVLGIEPPCRPRTTSEVRGAISSSPGGAEQNVAPSGARTLESGPRTLETQSTVAVSGSASHQRRGWAVLGAALSAVLVLTVTSFLMWTREPALATHTREPLSQASRGSIPQKVAIEEGDASTQSVPAAAQPSGVAEPRKLPPSPTVERLEPSSPARANVTPARSSRARITPAEARAPRRAPVPAPAAHPFAKH